MSKQIKMDKDRLEWHVIRLKQNIQNSKKDLKEIQKWYKKTILAIAADEFDLTKFQRQLKTLKK